MFIKNLTTKTIRLSAWTSPPKQLIGETRTPMKMEPGREQRVGDEYRRCGVANIFMTGEPLMGKQYTKITAKKKKMDWALFEFIYTPTRGSWLNMAKIELNVLAQQLPEQTHG